MVFHIAAAYGVAATAIVVLAAMGARNRQSGWKRERSDSFLDILMRWAEVKAEERQSSRVIQPAPTAIESQSASTDGLAALSAAVGIDQAPVVQAVTAPEVTEIKAR
jgi:hypothetical protein